MTQNRDILLQPLDRKRTGLIVIDVQEKIFKLVARSCEVLPSLDKIIRGFKILDIPIIVTEQYPQGLGITIPPIKSLLPDTVPITKTTFSCMHNPLFHEQILNSEISHWVLVGIEAHVCVLQTAKDILSAGKQVVILNDAISSRSIYDFSTAIAEMRDCGARISSTETVLFELLRDSKDPEFKQISQLIQKQSCGCC